VRGRYLEQSEWLSPTNIDNTGTVAASKGLTDWLANTGSPGDRFKLRSGIYWVPLGIGIGKAMTLDLNGSWLSTDVTLGPEDPDVTLSQAQHPPVYVHWDEDTAILDRRSVISIAASNVNILSSATNARIVGAARKVGYRGAPVVPEGIEYNSTFQGQHGIRIGFESSPNVFATIRNVDIDLTNISVEFCSGDGVYMIRNTDGVTIHGAQAGPSVVNANLVTNLGIPYLGATGGLPDGITVNGGGGGTYDIWQLGLTGYPGIHHTARQGIATDFPNANLTIRDISMWRIGRTAIDLEVVDASWEYDGVTIQRVEFGHWGLGHINNPVDGNADNVLIEDCICYKQPNIEVATAGGTPTRRTNWTIRRNRARFRKNNGGGATGGAAIKATAIDGLTIEDNYQMIEVSGQGLDLGDSTGITTSPAEDTQFVPTTPITYTAAFAGVAQAVSKTWNPTGPR
jgi:hypothetical protein